MTSKEKAKSDTMWAEALERLSLMEAHYVERCAILTQRAVEKRLWKNNKQQGPYSTCAMFLVKMTGT